MVTSIGRLLSLICIALCCFTNYAMMVPSKIRMFKAISNVAQSREFMSGLRAPKTIDFNINGVCNLDCKWCWGPVHDAQEDVNLSKQKIK